MATHDYQAVTRHEKDARIMEQWNTVKMVLFNNFIIPTFHYSRFPRTINLTIL
jgi:hypothetical protein